jgi:hypothetical protein
VVVVLVKCCPDSVAVTVTPGSTAPELSVTLPEIRPLVPCAQTAGATNNPKATPHPRREAKIHFNGLIAALMGGLLDGETRSTRPQGCRRVGAFLGPNLDQTYAKCYRMSTNFIRRLG